MKGSIDVSIMKRVKTMDEHRSEVRAMLERKLSEVKRGLNAESRIAVAESRSIDEEDTNRAGSVITSLSTWLKRFDAPVKAKAAA